MQSFCLFYVNKYHISKVRKLCHCVFASLSRDRGAGILICRVCEAWMGNTASLAQKKKRNISAAANSLGVGRKSFLDSNKVSGVQDTLINTAYSSGDFKDN